MKEQFRTQKFYKKSTDKLEKIKSILNEYKEKNTKVTLRQLFYQLVARVFIQGKKNEYTNLCNLMTKARYCGVIDWDAIEDRIRRPYRHSQFDNIQDLIQCAKKSYRLDRWQGQDYYVELFTEKDALSSIFQSVADEWHIYLSVNRGYDSSTAIYDASKRFLNSHDKKSILLYFGDHDPSGLDMVRDVRERLIELGCKEITVIPVALTFDQVQQYNLPANYTKIKDKRAKWYKQNYGNRCWEVDALPPDVLISLVESEIKKYVDVEKMNLVIKQEEEDIKRLENSIGGG